MRLTICICMLGISISALVKQANAEEISISVNPVFPDNNYILYMQNGSNKTFYLSETLKSGSSLTYKKLDHIPYESDLYVVPINHKNALFVSKYSIYDINGLVFNGKISGTIRPEKKAGRGAFRDDESIYLRHQDPIYKSITYRQYTVASLDSFRCHNQATNTFYCSDQVGEYFVENGRLHRLDIGAYKGYKFIHSQNCYVWTETEVFTQCNSIGEFSLRKIQNIKAQDFIIFTFDDRERKDLAFHSYGLYEQNLYYFDKIIEKTDAPLHEYETVFICHPNGQRYCMSKNFAYHGGKRLCEVKFSEPYEPDALWDYSNYSLKNCVSE